MRLAADFRNRAMECLKLADSAPTIEIRAHWTGMAQLWHNLATHLEETHVASEGCTMFAVIPTSDRAQSRH
jgi:hypothetical protein